MYHTIFNRYYKIHPKDTKTRHKKQLFICENGRIIQAKWKITSLEDVYKFDGRSIKNLQCWSIHENTADIATNIPYEMIKASHADV